MQPVRVVLPWYEGVARLVRPAHAEPEDERRLLRAALDRLAADQ
ncbi:hypothetical protein [Nonomuraea sp. NPDC050691]